MKKIERKSVLCVVEKLFLEINLEQSLWLSENLETLIKRYSNEAYDVLDSRVPKSICTSCKVALYERKNGKFSRSLPQMLDYLNNDLSNETCDDDNNHSCCCYICRTGRLKRNKNTLTVFLQPRNRRQEQRLKCAICVTLKLEKENRTCVDQTWLRNLNN